MCGIIGYIGKTNAVPILLDGLRRLEYRGYDSAGVAIFDGGRDRDAQTHRAHRESRGADPGIAASGPVGISHTRWATHGGVTDENAHPHFDQAAGSRWCTMA